MGATLLTAGCLTAFTPASPDDGIDHGGNPCSAAFFEALGMGSEDDDSGAALGDTTSSELKGTIEYCQEAARRRLAVSAVLVALGVAALVARQRMNARRPLVPTA